MDEAIKTLIEQKNGRNALVSDQRHPSDQKYPYDFSDAEIDEIYQQARQEAIADVKSMLRDHMVSSLIEKIINNDRPQISASDSAMQDVVENDSDSTRLEIERIRKKIFENEQLLQQIKTPAEASSASIQPVDSQITGSDHPELVATVGYYVFGVIKNDSSVSDDSNLPSLLDGVNNLGYPVYSLDYQDIQAVLCQVPLSEFEESALKNNLNNPVWLEANVVGHQSVLQALASNGPVIPMKFCTIYLSEERVLSALEDYYPQFTNNLQLIQGKQEWGVKLYFDQCEITQQVKLNNPRLQEIQAGIAKKSEGVAYFARKKLEVATSEEVERFSDQVAQTCHDRLTACAFKSCITPLQSTEVTGRTDKMALNGAYLIENLKIDLFQAELEALKALFAPSGAKLELSGPWPPYNFVAVEAEATHPHD